MNQKEYELYDGRTITFFFDDGKVGYITLHAMDALVGEIQKLAAERDAAVGALEIRQMCEDCKWYNTFNHYCEDVEHEVCDGSESHWEWRGVQDG